MDSPTIAFVLSIEPAPADRTIVAAQDFFDITTICPLSSAQQRVYRIVFSNVTSSHRWDVLLVPEIAPEVHNGVYERMFHKAQQ